jgi:sterol desaturase/sphingolipid hydroxylase (fatty acid hydroxylase superfamily)
LPYRREWLADQGDFKLDFFFTNILFPIVAKVGEVLISVALIFFLSEQSRKGIAAYWPSHLPLAVQFIMILLLCEFIYYWLHRAAHTWIPLWNFHSIHHSVKRVYWNNAGRFHPIDLGLNTFLYVSPFFIFAVPEILLALFVITNAVTGLLEHANIDFRLGQLNRIFNSAELHRWHHSLESKESNSNYGKIISFWDQVFGSYHYDGTRGVGRSPWRWCADEVLETDDLSN